MDVIESLVEVDCNCYWHGHSGHRSSFQYIHNAVVPPMDPCVAELHDIAAAITYTSAGSFTSSISIIFTDSMAACRRLIHNSLPLAIAEQIEHDLLSPVEVVWIPGHGGMPGNEKAHLLGRETLHRAPDIPRSAETFPVALPSLESYRQARRVFPPLHTHLTRHQGTILRNAQSNTLPTPARSHLIIAPLPRHKHSMLNLARRAQRIAFFTR